VGLDRPTAARFSFLLSLPAVFGAGLLELIKDREELLKSNDSIFTLILATIVSGIVGYAAIAGLIAYLRRHTMTIFIVYRIALGLILLFLLTQGILQP
jgi:undecaprenyl-diphosphatase